MPSKAKPGKREAILDAMLDVVVERGFHEAPMSLIAQRSGASAGVIYHHFASKEEIIQALYERVYALKLAGMLRSYSPDLEAGEAFILVWTNAYNFYRRHAREMRFLEQYETAGFPCRPAATPLAEAGAEFLRRFSPRSRGGMLNDWPPEVLEEMTVGLAARLAKHPRRLTSAALREIAAKLWDTIRAR